MARITEVHIYDFDATLFRSPQKPDWWQGPWWSNPESLSPPCVPQSPPGSWWVSNVMSKAKASISAGNVYACICTGRQQKVEPRVKEILRSGGLSFDALFLKPGGDTASFKKKVLSGLVRKFPGAVIHFWEDRHDHLRSFMKHIESEGGVGVPHPVPEQYGVVMCGPEDLGMAKSASSTRVAHRFLTRKTARGAKEVIPWVQQELNSGKEWEWHVWGTDSDGEDTLWKIHGRGDGYYSLSYEDYNAYGGWRTQFTYEADVKKLYSFRPFINMKSVSWDQRKAGGLPLTLRPDYGMSDEPQRGDDSDFTKEGANKRAFNKYNPDELLSQLVEVLDKYELEDAVDAVKKLTPTVQKAWRSRER